ncbi:hypothetical protein TNCV_2858511 [Trichonephila clavipes]|nr:hypothetical protein TNCV_2858511 [Trichonephila clavipes]
MLINKDNSNDTPGGNDLAKCQEILNGRILLLMSRITLLILIPTYDVRSFQIRKGILGGKELRKLAIKGRNEWLPEPVKQVGLLYDRWGHHRYTPPQFSHGTGGEGNFFQLPAFVVSAVTTHKIFGLTDLTSRIHRELWKKIAVDFYEAIVVREVLAEGYSPR